MSMCNVKGVARGNKPIKKPPASTVSLVYSELNSFLQLIVLHSQPQLYSFDSPRTEEQNSGAGNIRAQTTR